MQPFAVELYYRMLRGKSAEELSRELGIPLDRIEARLKAAEAFLRQADHPVQRGATLADLADLR